MFKKLFKKRKGAALVEYGLLIGGIALISSAAVSIFGHKTSDIIGAMAAILPGAHVDDNGPMISGKLIETTNTATGQGSGGAIGGAIALDFEGIAGNKGTSRLGVNLGAPGGSGSSNAIDSLILEAN